MDKYLTNSQPLRPAIKQERTAGSSTSNLKTARHHPYSRTSTSTKKEPSIIDLTESPERSSTASSSGQIKPKVSARKLTLALLSTLKDEDNPITHSKAYFKTEHIVSCASGHQVNDGGGRSSTYMKARNARLESQAQERVQDSSVTVFRGLVIYVNGYCRGTTDTEIKRLVISGGGKISHSNHGGVTHIVTSMQLSARKTEQFKNVKARRPTHVVTPDWVKDCFEQRKLLQEWKYNVIDLKNDVHISG